MLKRATSAVIWVATLSVALVLSELIPAHAGSRSITAKGLLGQTLMVSPARNVSDKQIVTVTGKNFDTKIGIYVAYCEIPQKGMKPENCFGGINIDGSSKGSIWISSNAPLYAKFLTRPFGKNGSFKVEVMTSRFIGNTDCKIKRCGVVTRADHYRSDFRKADVLVPITFK